MSRKNSNFVVSGDYSTSLTLPVFNAVAKGTSCLDVGCFNGNLGRELIREKGCVVDGIDYREDMLKEAKKNGYRNTYLHDLSDQKLNFSDISEKYDFIIFADVLEHLVNPKGVLALLKPKLKDDGRVIISLPNVAFILNRFFLLIGKWDYKEFGTLDKTHLKFFTIKSAQGMVEESGFKVRKITPYNQFKKLTLVKPFLKIFPGLFAYQFLIECEKAK